MLQVRKKDDRLEDFDRGKILAGLQNAGVAAEDAEQMTARVEEWAQNATVEEVISSAEIKTKLLELLRETDPTAAATFEAYKKESVEETAEEI